MPPGPPPPHPKKPQRGTEEKEKNPGTPKKARRVGEGRVRGGDSVEYSVSNRNGVVTKLSGLFSLVSAVVS